jgi:aryl carrier-like protein
MSWEDWMAANYPKVTGTWNLHQAFLDTELDIFWLASSTVTVVDQPGQGNYKAGSTFVESFCQYRHSLGLPASVLSICPIDDVGYVAENAYAKRNGIAQGLYFLGEQEFLDAVEATILTQAPRSAGTGTKSHAPWQSTGHIVMGLRSELHLDDPKNPTNWRRDRRMGLYHNRPIEEASKAESESSSLKQFLKTLAGGDAAAILAEDESIEFIAVETGRKIYDFLLKPDTPVDTSLSLSQVGLDSLTAIELRRWFRQAFGLSVSVLEIMGSASLKQLGETTAGKLKEKHAATA